MSELNKVAKSFAYCGKFAIAAPAFLIAPFISLLILLLSAKSEIVLFASVYDTGFDIVEEVLAIVAGFVTAVWSLGGNSSSPVRSS